jgi:hypothetical protein
MEKTQLGAPPTHGLSGVAGVASFRSDRDFIEDQLPELTRTDYEVRSDPTIAYNCFAWAARDADHYWDPLMIGEGYFWPLGPPACPNIESYIAAYETQGFRVCDSPDLEEDKEKIAIFVDGSGDPFHAARQLPSGRWTSKLGDIHDIEHELVDIDGARLLGRLAVFLERPCPGPPPVPPGYREIIRV